MEAVEGEPRGVLGLRAGRRSFEVSRSRPSPALAGLVEHYWTVRWDLRGRDPHTQHTLPHPSVHLVAERDRSGIMGVLTGRFTRELEGEGRAFGVKFRPAGFHPFLGAPVSSLTDRRLAVAEVFGPAGDDLVADLLAAPGDPELAATAEAFLLTRLPEVDPNVPAVNRVVGLIMADREITRVQQVTDRTGIGARRLQRLFATYTGVTPKWVIQRSRLHEAVERLDQGDHVDLGFLARDLGYFDQAHFARDFRATVGRPPTAYTRPRGSGEPGSGSGHGAPVAE
ncbi:MAG TPA: helix-turn-helix domain-containing protein [Actinomycetota bacterium]|nr:helix-turn-helix domain-containing protein [Actinomycetota bacterium]